MALRALVGGIQETDVAELEKTARDRRQLQYKPLRHQTHLEIWTIAHGFSYEKRRMLLEFATTSSRAPANGIGSFLFVIQRIRSDTDRVSTA